MRKRQIWLPDRVDDIGLARAKQSGIDLSGLYAGLVSDILLENRADGTKGPEINVLEPPVPPDQEGTTDRSESGTFQPRLVSGFIHGSDGRLTDRILNLEELENGLFYVFGEGGGAADIDWGSHFDVSAQFRGFPNRSIVFAQRVVDEAMKLPGVVPTKHKNGITFKPNFLWIEALLQRKSGIRVSLYGAPESFIGAPTPLGAGRGSYSRIVIEQEEKLENLLPLVRQAYEHRLEPKPGQETTSRKNHVAE